MAQAPRFQTLWVQSAALGALLLSLAEGGVDREGCPRAAEVPAMGSGVSQAAHQGLRQLLHPSSIYPAPPSHCQAPGIPGGLKPVKPSLEAPALQVLPPDDREHRGLFMTMEEGRAVDLGLLSRDPTGMSTGQSVRLSQGAGQPLPPPSPTCATAPTPASSEGPPLGLGGLWCQGCQARPLSVPKAAS